MKALEPPDSHHLNAALGWLELGNPTEANEELEKITAILRTHPAVLDLRWQIYAAAKKWDVCVDIGEALVKLASDSPDGWIRRSFALHELKRTREAAEKLQPAEGMFPSVWRIKYNLACYACQLGDHKRAWYLLDAAIALAGESEEDVKKQALEDPDLEPFWRDIGKIPI